MPADFHSENEWKCIHTPFRPHQNYNPHLSSNLPGTKYVKINISYKRVDNELEDVITVQKKT